MTTAYLEKIEKLLEKGKPFDISHVLTEFGSYYKQSEHIDDEIHQRIQKITSIINKEPPLCPYCKKHVEIKVEIREIEPFVPLYCKNCGVLLSIMEWKEGYKYLSTHLYPD